MNNYTGILHAEGAEGAEGAGGTGVAEPGRATGVRAAMPADADVMDLADVFGLLADPGRLRLLVALRHGELRVGDLAAVAGLSESAASHALRLLRAHHVVAVRRSGRRAYYSLADAHVRTLLDLALAHVEHSDLIHHRGGHDG